MKVHSSQIITLDNVPEYLVPSSKAMEKISKMYDIADKF